uniref:Elongator acetyltransferase complex subunit 6 n=1 Tax=Nomascus leucogenys TaxID=61853 RepID=A0A2I3GSI8_NOMLE
VARERGQLVFLEGLKSAVDVVFQAQKEPHPLQFLRHLRKNFSAGLVFNITGLRLVFLLFLLSEHWPQT